MTIKEQHKPWQVRLQGTDEAHSAEQNGRVNVRGCFAFPSTDEEIMLPLCLVDARVQVFFIEHELTCS